MNVQFTAASYLEMSTAALVAFVIYFEITVMCSVLLCLHVDQPVSGFEEGGSRVM